jgi:segregation and condensation protein A
VFHVRLPDFDGPLDLLLTLAERREMDAATLAIAVVVQQYFGLLRAAGTADLDALASAIAITARLMELKSRALLPAPEPAPIAEEGDGGAAEDLTELLAEYRRFKLAAAEFRDREQERLRSFPRMAPPPAAPAGPGLSNVTLDRLVAVVRAALQRRPPEPSGDVPRPTVTVRERLAELEAALRVHGRIHFHAFIAACRGRIEIVIGFMAVLELIKGGRATAEQPEPFGDILIVAHLPVMAGVD